MSKASGYCDPAFAKIGDVFTKAIESEFELGASLAIEHKGKMVVDMFGGHKDIKRTKPWEENTIVNVFSVTKGVAATCIAKLIDEGKLDVNNKVSFYWPEYGCNGKENTRVSDLLCHRSAMFGFQDGMPSGQWQNWEVFTKALETQKPFKEPGSAQGYHALTYGWLVGEIIRRVDGRHTGQYFTEEIAEPFGIDFQIGLNQSDFERCADMIMLDDFGRKKNSIDYIELIKYVPNLILPKRYWNLKEAIKGGDFKVAFEGREEDPIGYHNLPDWRMAQVPSANGHGTAHSLAKLYGILSNGCQRDGHQIMKPETLDYAIIPLSSGPDSVLFGSNITFGLGYELGKNSMPVGNFAPKFKNAMFGHAGVGGGVAFGDIENQLGFGFVCNQMHEVKNLYKTVNEIMDALFAKLENK